MNATKFYSFSAKNKDSVKERIELLGNEQTKEKEAPLSKRLATRVAKD